MDFKEAIGAIVAGVALLVPAVKWLIKDWAEKNKEVEQLRSANTAKALSRLEDDVKGFRSAVDSINASIRDLQVSLTVNKSEVELLKEQLKSTIKMIEQYSRDFDNKIGNRIKTELVELSKRAQLIREKKNNGES